MAQLKNVSMYSVFEMRKKNVGFCYIRLGFDKASESDGCLPSTITGRRILFSLWKMLSFH